jgi:hypothetical protein
MWKDILKIEWQQEELIDEIMSDGEGRSVREVIDAMFEPQHQGKKVRIPTPAEVKRYFQQEYYRSEREKRRHPLALPDDTRTKSTTIYYAR